VTRNVHRAALGASAVFVAGLVYCLASCANSTTTTLYTPFTGLLISAPTLFAGYTCGVGAGQIFAYAAVVSDMGTDGPQPTGLPTANVYACKDDAEFQNLPGSGFYRVRIYAYSKAAFPADLACAPNACAPPTAASDFSTATWTTTCTGSQESGDNALVQCSPLRAASAGAEDANGSAQSDAGAGTAVTDAMNAPDGGALDSSALGSDGGAADDSAPETSAPDADAIATDADAGATDADAGATDADTGATDADTGATDADASAADADAGALDDGAPDADSGD
jgi:hypothetical protein